MPMAQLNDIQLYYHIQGQGEPILLIGGLSRDHTIWDPIAAELSQSFQVIRFDNRGAGRSSQPKGSYEIEQMAEDTHQLLEQLDLTAINVVGHSLGGFIALYLAALHPDSVKKLFILGSSIKTEDEAKPYLKQRIELAEASRKNTREENFTNYREHIVPQLYSAAFIQQATQLEQQLRKEATTTYPQSIDGFIGQAKAALNYDASEICQTINTPALIATGEYDRLVPPKNIEPIVNALSNAKMEIIAAAGHMANIEKPTLLSEMILGFFRE